MRRTRQPASKSSRLGHKGYKSPPPLRFETVGDARKYIKANKMRVRSTSTHTRGHRIDVVTPEGKVRTLSIMLKKEA